MKHTFFLYIIALITSLYGSAAVYSQTGDTRSNPIVAGTYSSSFTYSDTKNTQQFTNQYTGKSTNDVFYKFTITVMMDVTISLCNSELNDTFLHLLDASGNFIASNDDSDVCTHLSYRSYLSRQSLPAGTYYVVSEGYHSNGNITTRIEGKSALPGENLTNPIIAGSFNGKFTYTDTKNSTNYTTPYGGGWTSGVFYKFTIAQAMDVTISTCNSQLERTNLFLLNSSGTQIAFNKGNNFCGPNSFRASLTLSLAAGTYYVISKGDSNNGNITTRIEGGSLPFPEGYNMNYPINAGTYNNYFQYTDTKNTQNFSNQYNYRPANDVFYKFTTTQAMDITVSTCESEVSDTYIYLLDASGLRIAYNDDSYQCGSAKSYRSHIRMTSLPAGTYYVVAEGYSENGNVTTRIEGTVTPPTGDNMNNPIVAGSFGSGFSYTDTKNTQVYTNQHLVRPTKDVFYRFTITQEMNITVSLCNSALGSTYVSLLDASGNGIKDGGASNQCGTGSERSKIQVNPLPPGTYYVVSEGYSTDGSITTQISGEIPTVLIGDEMNNPFVAGSFSNSFTYTDTKNTQNYRNNYPSFSTNDVFYKFTITKAMNMVISTCGSELSDTHAFLLNASGVTISNNINTYNCSSNTHQNYLIMYELAAGTYYVVTKGTFDNGNITTRIEGTVPPSAGDNMQDPINLGSFSSNFSYTDTKNTQDYTNQYNGQPTKDVFYKFSISQRMKITASLCNSALSNTYVSILDASGSLMYYGWASSNCGTGSGRSYVHINSLPPGTYYVVSEGFSTDGSITTQISGEILPQVVGDDMQNPIVAGTFNDSFQYTDTKYTRNFNDKFARQNAREIFYKFTITQAMKVLISQCNSQINDSYLYLLDASGNQMEVSSYSFECADGRPYITKASLPAGTYYAVSEEYHDGGNITTRIEGISFSVPIPDVPPVPDVPVAANGNLNYIHTYSAMEKTGNPANLNTVNSLQTIQYFDGLGRPVEAVNVAFTPSRKDMVSVLQYDNFGRESKSWLPAAVNTGGNGSFRTFDSSLESQIKSCYNSDSRPYSEPAYEASPLNRVLEQYGPGQDWKAGNRRMQTAYRANNSNDVLYFYISNDNLVCNSGSRYYPAGTLYAVQQTDEDNHVSLQYTDKLGRVVLERRIDEAGDKLDTYYAYDDEGNLRYVLPPKASKACEGGGSFNASTASINENAYVYRYDHRRRCIEKKLPGAGWVSMVYDRSDRLILVQDAVQQPNSKWNFYLYDNHGRTVLEGETTIRNDRPTLATRYEAKLITSEWTGSGIFGYPSHPDLTVQESEVNRANYYDRDNWITDNSLRQTARSGYDTPYGSLRGRLSGTVNRTLGDVSTTVAASFYYDSKGNAVQTHSKNHLGGYDHEYVAYSLTGQPLKRLTEHSAPGQPAIREEYAYKYDHAGRLRIKTHALDGAAPTLMASHTYDEQGRLLTKNTAGRETSTYVYNLRGWTTSVDGNRFSEKLFYQKTSQNATGSFNGNISESQTRTGAGATYDRYLYTYDYLDRLRDAAFSNPSTGANYRESFTYDRQGNITGMQRWGLLQTHVFGQIDNVTFSYRGNQLLSASETLPNQNLADLMEFKKNTSTTYSYDTNGRLTTDLNKKISSITYNWLHLPSYVNYQDGNRVAYTYQASGVKLQTKYYSTGSSTPVTRDYAANKVYENNALKMILTEDGYITKESGAYKHHYYLRDHLGSNRVTIDQAGNIIQMANYYPFGALQAEKPSRGDQAKQPYLYNGKELDRQYGLDALDYGARIYDPVAGRFGTMDPMAEKYYSISPYAYCANNPVNRIDPTGMDWYTDKDGSYQYNPELNQDNQSEKLKKGQSYVGATYQVKDKSGRVIENYRKDGSIMFSNETSGYKRIWDNTQKTGREEMAVITNSGVLVMPSYKNAVDDATIQKYGYSWENGKLVDPVSQDKKSIVGTIHTHPILEKTPDGKVNPSWMGPSGWDHQYFGLYTPNKPFFVITADMKIHSNIMVNAQERIPVILPSVKGVSPTLNNIISGKYFLINVLNANKR